MLAGQKMSLTVDLNKMANYFSPTKLKIILAIIFFIFTPIISGWIIIPFPLILLPFLAGPAGILMLFSSGIIILRFIVGLFFSYYLACFISKRYLNHLKKTNRKKAIGFLIGISILMLIVYFILFSIITVFLMMMARII